MDENARTSCWGVTVWTVALFSAILATGFLFADAGTHAVAVAAG